MKRTAADAGFPEAPHPVRVVFRLPQEHWGQSMNFQFQACPTALNVAVSWMVSETLRLPTPARW